VELAPLLKQNGGNLGELIIKPFFGTEYIRLKNVNVLCGKVDKFIIGGVDAKEYASMIIKNPRYRHISSIEGSTYHLVTRHIPESLVQQIYKADSDFEFYSDNILVNKLSDSTYQLIFATRYAEGQHDDTTVRLLTVDKKFVCKIIFCRFKKGEKKNLDSIDDFEIPDDDTIDSLTDVQEEYEESDEEDEDGDEEN
jgi:hypothetical protein